MIHKFKMHGSYMVLDVNSGSVHVIDPLTYDLLSYIEKPTDETCSINLPGYPQEEVEEAYQEIRELYQNGLLFTKDDYAEIAENINRQTPIKALCLHVSHDCNLRCGYCFAGTGQYCGERELMSEEVGKAAIDFVIEKSGARKNIEIDFFGGEPLMNFDVVKKVADYAMDQGKLHNKTFRLTITTNGVLLDEEKLAYINENMSNLVLSIDGRKEVNDHMRKTVTGDGSYDVIKDKLLRAADSRNQMNYYARGTFTHHNLDFSEDVFHLADLGFKQISVEPVVGGKEQDYSIKEEDLPIIFDQYEKLAKKYVNADFNFFHFMIDLTGGPCVIKRLSGCGAGCEYVAVTPEGDIYPCHQFVGNEQFKLGNVTKNDFNQNLVKDFANTNVYTKPDCKECWAKFFCSGGCHANAYQFGGSIQTPYSIGCEMERKRVECALYIEACRRLGDEAHI